MTETLYSCLGGYDAIAAVADNLLPRLQQDQQLARFWLHRGEDGVRREKQLLVDFLCASAGGPLFYVGRDMKTAHKGMGITDADFNALVEDLTKSLNKFNVPAKEQGELLGILGPLKPQIVGQ